MESDLTPESATLARDSSRYAFPDLRDEVLEITNYLGEHEQFAIKFGLMVLPAVNLRKHLDAVHGKAITP